MVRLKTVKGKGWSGVWASGGLGWLMPKFVSNYPETLSPEQKESLNNHEHGEYAKSDFYRVEITIRPLKDKKGKYIVRRAKEEIGDNE